MLGASKLTKYIKCEGCRKFATELYGQAQALLSEHKGRKKMGEEPVLEMLEAMCNEGDKGGEWLNGIDVVGTKGELQLQTKDGFQDCSSDECKAVVRVCDSVKTEAGESDLAEMIYRGHYMTDADAFAQRICTKMTESCGEAPVVLKDARIDEPFAAMDSKKWEAKKMQKMMKGMGMGAQMYDRESMADMLAEEGMGEGGDMPPGLTGAGGMGGDGGSGAHPPPPAGDAPPAFPMQDVFKEVGVCVRVRVRVRASRACVWDSSCRLIVKNLSFLPHVFGA